MQDVIAATAPVVAADDSGERQADDRLVDDARADPRAFRFLYERHVRAVYSYLRARGVSEDDAADLAATAFERALVGLRAYRPAGAGFRAWLLRIARNAAIDASRRQRPATSLEAVDPSAHSLGPRLVPGLVGPGPEGALVDAERRAEVRRLVGGLPDVQREAVVLRYASGLTAREIGVVIGKSEDATQKLLTRALARLKEAYREQE